MGEPAEPVTIGTPERMLAAACLGISIVITFAAVDILTDGLLTRWLTSSHVVRRAEDIARAAAGD